MRHMNTASLPNDARISINGERVAFQSWNILLLVIVGSNMLRATQHPQWAGALVVSVLLLANTITFRLARKHSPWVLLWHTIVVVPLLALAPVIDLPISTAWLVIPVDLFIVIVLFSRRYALMHILGYTGICIGDQIASVLLHITPSPEPLFNSIIRIAFVPLLGYLMLRLCQRESALMQEVATHIADTNAMTAISWSLTSLAPSSDDIGGILQRACPPDVSLGLMRFAEDGTTLTTVAAVGEEANMLLPWKYVVRPDSIDMVAQALRDRRAIVSSIDSNDGGQMIGALPATHALLRSAAIVPIMRQQAAPVGVLLAVSSSSEAAARIAELGILPAVANQFAISIENARLFEAAQERADHDALTGLYHHRAIHQRLNEEIGRADRTAAPFAIAMIDLDRFKLFNDTYGHQVGDRILIHTTHILRRALRQSDILGRFGGDEFLAILPDTDPAEALLIARQLNEAFAAIAFRPNEHEERMPLSVSIGVALYPNDGRTAVELIGCAEVAMQDAHHDGGNTCRITQREMSAQRTGRAIDLRGFGILEALVTAVDHKDHYTKEHSEEVATYAQLLAEKIGWSHDRAARLFDAGLLHDVGKVGVPDIVLRKPGRLTDEEFDAMKRHVVLSDALLRCLLPADTDQDIIDAVRYHHERWDGKGYPFGLAGEDVPLAGRILIVADATSAMHMDRPYRKGLTPAHIISELRRWAGVQFDPALVEPFIEVLREYYHISDADVRDDNPLPTPAPRSHAA
jgi:diguanylate cyclase (GGDEF)-like protein